MGWMQLPTPAQKDDGSQDKEDEHTSLIAKFLNTIGTWNTMMGRASFIIVAFMLIVRIGQITDHHN